MIRQVRDYGAVTVITAQTSAAPAADPADTQLTPDTADTPPPVRAALAGAIDAQAHRMDQLSAAIVRATAQVAWSGRAAERFRTRAAERSRECLQLAVALRASADRVHVAAMGPDRVTGRGRVGGAPEPFGEPVAMTAAGPGYPR